MKRNLAWLTSALLFGALVTLSGCGKKEAEAGSPSASAAPSGEQKKYKFGFANLAESAPFFVDVRQGIEKAAKEKGIELVVADNKMDGATALSNAENFITQKVDFVIEFQTDEKFGKVIMDKFNEKGIKVIAIDIPMPGAVFFGVDNATAGFMAGEALGKKVKEQWEGKIDKVIMLELPQSGEVPARRMKGQLDGLKSIMPDIKESDLIRLDSKGALEEAKRVMTDTLTTIPNAKRIAVLSINDDTALGALAALEAANRSGNAMIVGQGADKRGREEMIKDKTPFIGSTAYFPEKYGEYIVPAALEMLAGKDVGKEILMKHVFVNKENVKQIYPE